MNIVYSSDDNYARHCAASMVSIMENNREEEKLDFWMLNVGLSEDNLEKLASVCRKYGRTLHVVDFSDIRSRFPAERIPLSSFTIETYARLFLADALPETEHRAMWMDGDTVTVGSLHDMYCCDMQGCPVAGVVDQPNFGLSLLREDAGFEDGPYFCAGVFVADLDAWRRENLADAFIAYFAERQQQGNLMFMDQAILNHVLHGRIHKLPMRCQMITPTCFLSYRQMLTRWGEPYYAKAEYYEAKRHPLIVHYVVFRPWKRWCLHPLKRYYRRYLAMTPYKGTPLENDGLAPVLRKVRTFAAGALRKLLRRG